MLESTEKTGKAGRRPSDGSSLARRARQELGVRLTWDQAEEVLSMSRRAIQVQAFEALREVAPTLDGQKAVLEAEGFQFPLAGRLVWVGRRGRNYVVRVRV